MGLVKGLGLYTGTYGPLTDDATNVDGSISRGLWYWILDADVNIITSSQSGRRSSHRRQDQVHAAGTTQDFGGEVT